MPGTWSITIQAMNSDPSQVSQSHWWVKANLLTPRGCCPLTSSHSSSTMRFISFIAWNGHFFQNTNIQRLSECLNLNFAIKISEKNGTHWKSIAKIKHMDMFFYSSREKNKKTSRSGGPCWAVLVSFSFKFGWAHDTNKMLVPNLRKLTSRGIWSHFSFCWGIVVVLGILVPDIKRWDVFLCGQKKYVFKFDCELYLW